MSSILDNEKSPASDTKAPTDNISETASVIYIEPEKEAAAIRKFDTFLVPVSLLFIILSALDRNNVRRNPAPAI
jgi:hypothetical protein